MSEYELLRAEILLRSEARTQYNNILYAVVAAILTYAFSQDNYFLFLVPYIVILPLYLLSENSRRSTVRLATYMYVFLEGQEYHWETRQWEQDKMNRAKRSTIAHYFYLMKTRTQYFLVSLICSISATYKVISSNMDKTGKCASFLFIWILAILVIIIMMINITDYTKIKYAFIQQWQAVKAAEEQEAQKRKNNNRNPQ